mmetsp:Transcript_77169/g.213315  ORF Transcript_77169/g.213315 Transcript_77169/m.213315 type:complete len:229 (-) Transcript_77169:38-724(-)
MSSGGRAEAAARSPALLPAAAAAASPPSPPAPAAAALSSVTARPTSSARLYCSMVCWASRHKASSRFCASWHSRLHTVFWSSALRKRRRSRTSAASPSGTPDAVPAWVEDGAVSPPRPPSLALRGHECAPDRVISKLSPAFAVPRVGSSSDPSPLLMSKFWHRAAAAAPSCGHAVSIVAAAGGAAAGTAAASAAAGVLPTMADAAAPSGGEVAAASSMVSPVPSWQVL